MTRFNTREKRGQCMHFPHTCHALSKKQKIIISVKMSQEYSSSIRNLMLMKDLNLVDLKLHNYHALMQNYYW